MSSFSAQIEGAIPARHRRTQVQPWAIFTIPWRHRALIYRLARREIESRYRGSALGIIWSVLIPLFMLGVYTMVFGGILHATWTIPPGGKGSFFLILFMGLIIVNFFAECAGRAPVLMLSNVSYIKRVVFPLEILPVVLLLSAAFDLVLSLIVLVLIFIPVLGLPFATIFLLPLVLTPLMFATLGIVWFISSLGVYLRDLRMIISVVLAALPFLCPVFFQFEAFDRLGSGFKQLLFLNPITVPVVQSRQVLFFNELPSWKLWLAYTACSLVLAYAGLLWFKYSQKGFADVV